MVFLFGLFVVILKLLQKRMRKRSCLDTILLSFLTWNLFSSSGQIVGGPVFPYFACVNLLMAITLDPPEEQGKARGRIPKELGL